MRSKNTTSVLMSHGNKNKMLLADLNTYENGNSVSTVAAIFNLAKSTIYNYLERFAKGHLEADKKTSHPKKVSDEELKDY